uniref:Ig-like domain-containing protein n=1 Tax=Tetranychus urticae TaxID=32264 RepID=T1KSY2_TETUR
MKCTKKVKGNEVNGNNLRMEDNNSDVSVEQTEPYDGCVIYHQEEIYPESRRLNSYKGGENESNVNIADIIKDRDTAYKIEEQIEEITTTTTAPDEEEDGVDSAVGSEGYKDSVDSDPERRRHVDSLLDPYGLDLNSKGCARVAFPELGLDIMDLAYLDRDDDDETNEKLINGDNMDESKLTNKVKVVDDFSWEENWLFQKKRKAENDVAPLYCLLNLSESTNPVCMFIPNPSQNVPRFIGLTAVDQLSDLTERNSVGSLEFSSDEESESDETEVQSSSSYPLENIKCSSSAKLKCLNSAANHKSSSPLAPLKIPDFIPSNKRSSSLTCNQPFIANTGNNNQTKSTNGAITNANNDDPTFTLLPQSANVQSDILIQFCCRVKGSQPLGVAWYRKGQLIGGTIERGRFDQFNVEPKDEFDQMFNKDGVETKDFKTFKHFTDHILEIKSTRVDLSGTYSACVFNHVNQHWIDFNVKIYPKKDYHPYRFPRSSTKSFQKVVSSPPPTKQRSTKANSTSNGPKVLSETFHSHRQENEVLSSCHPDEASLSPRIASIAEREHKKWEESTVAWPDNPYTTENVGKRKHLNQFLDSLDPSSGGDPRNRIEDDEANLHALPYISPSKDMGRFKRDYYVPNVPKEHETCNGFDEKVYSSVKYFSASESPGLNYSETDLINSHEESTLPGKILIPTVTTTAPTPTVSCSSSPLPSAGSSSSSCSPGLPRIINEHHLQYKHAEAQVLENLGNITSLVSVKELINRFSAYKESTNPMNGQYLKDSTNFYSLNRDGTLANSGTGINPRLITDKHKFSVPFKLSCWLDDENGDNNGHDMYHDENDNINDSNLSSPRNKVNCHENNAKSQSIELTKDFNNHHEKNNCHHEMLYHQQEPNHVNGEQSIDYYQRSNSEVSLPSLMSPPPPILPPRPQPRLSTKSNQANSSQARLNSTKPQHPLAVNSITGRCLNKEYRNWTNKNQSNPSSNLMGSLSLYDINQASETSGKFESSNPASPGVRSQSNTG